MINASCPLCKSPVTIEEIERVAQMYTRKLDQHDKCCSEKNNKSGQDKEASNDNSCSDSKTCSSHYGVNNSQLFNRTLINEGDFNSHDQGRKSHRTD